MSRRKVLHVVVKRDADSPPPPNETTHGITVDLRVVFPPGADQVEVLKAYDQATREMTNKIFQYYAKEEMRRGEIAG